MKSNLNLPALDSQDNGYSSVESELSKNKYSDLQNQSVKDLLLREFPSFLDKLDSRVERKINSMLDLEDPLFSVNESIRDQSFQSLSSFVPCQENISDYFDQTIKHCNVSFFKRLILLNYFPSYQQINDLLLLLGLYNKDLLLYAYAKDMIIFYLYRGGKLDPYQYNMLKRTKNSARLLLRELDQTFRFFDTEDDEMIRILAYILDFDPKLDHVVFLRN